MKYEQLKIGDRAELKHRISESDIQQFIALTGDDNKLHCDAAFARNTDFKVPVAHGMLGASFISTVIGTKIPGDGALWFSQQLDFLLPVRVGDEITVVGEIIKKNDHDHVIELKTEIFNQHKQRVTTGVAKIKVVEPKAEPVPLKETSAKQKVALVIGATGGIGQATVVELAQRGFAIIAHYHQNKNAALVLKEKITSATTPVLLCQADITNPTAVSEMFAAISRHHTAIDVLVNCTTPKVPNIRFDAMQWSDMELHCNTNIRGSFLLIKAALPFLCQAQKSRIITLVTQYIEAPKPEMLHYITAKAALSGFSKALALELAPLGVRVNMVSPSMTETDLIADVPQKMRALIEAKTPLKRLAKPQDVAKAIAFLASDDSDFITGETLRVNGGQVLL